MEGELVINGLVYLPVCTQQPGAPKCEILFDGTKLAYFGSLDVENWIFEVND